MCASLSKEIHKAANDPTTIARLLEKLVSLLEGRRFSFMEVCGTHTTSIFRSGLRSLLPKEITHLSGPGCPVCVTHESEVEYFLKLAQEPKITIATFGDLLRIPGSSGLSLKNAQASGASVQIVYSPLEALQLAMATPEKEIVFLGTGFETTAPAVSAMILKAKKDNIKNLSVFSFHKLVPPVLRKLLKEKNHIDAFLLPGHVATITGVDAFAFISAEYGVPAVIGGFEPVDILGSLCDMARLFVQKKAMVLNDYPRAVKDCGNPAALAIMNTVFETTNAKWRGMGEIEQSGLKIVKQFSEFDAKTRFPFTITDVPSPTGCKCGEILKGHLQPVQCPLFAKKCSPANPIGPCMVSTEGSCAAYYKYGFL